MQQFLYTLLSERSISTAVTSSGISLMRSVIRDDILQQTAAPHIWQTLPISVCLTSSFTKAHQ
jgi:hypothetical protein